MGVYEVLYFFHQLWKSDGPPLSHNWPWSAGPREECYRSCRMAEKAKNTYAEKDILYIIISQRGGKESWHSPWRMSDVIYLSWVSVNFLFSKCLFIYIFYILYFTVIYCNFPTDLLTPILSCRFQHNGQYAGEWAPAPWEVGHTCKATSWEPHRPPPSGKPGWWRGLRDRGGALRSGRP